MRVWPNIGLTVYAEDGVTVIPAVGGADVPDTQYYRDLKSAFVLLDRDPLEGSGDAVTVSPFTRVAAALVGQVTPQLFGALGDGVTDDTAAIQEAIDVASASGAEVRFPPGTYMVSGIRLRNGSVLNGSGRNSTVIKQIDPGGPAGALVSRASGISGTLTDCMMRGLRLSGADGRGGTGLELESFFECHFENLTIATFRNAGNTGVGVSMFDSAQGLCTTNTFVNVKIADSDTGLLMDSVNATYACGYNQFFGLTIHQENDCIVMRRTQPNGSIYNTFHGVFLQGTPSGGKGIICAGQGNTFIGLVIDALPGEHIKLTSASSGNNFYSPWVDETKITNNYVTGALNTVYGLGTMVGCAGQDFVVKNVLTGETALMVQATGANGPELRMANDGSALQWRLALSSGDASAQLRVLHNSTTVQRYHTDGIVVHHADSAYDTNSQGPRLIDRTTGTVYRLRVIGGVLSIEAV